MSERIDAAAARLLGISRASGTEKGLVKDIRTVLDALTVAQGKALLSQQTPTAEPCCSRPGDSNWHTADGGHVVPPDVEEYTPDAPPSIADMMPRTTFTAGWPHTGRPTQWVVLNDGVRCIEHGRGYYGTAWSITDAPVDPSTIRDVTPPKDATS